MRKRIAISSWETPADPHAYVPINYDVEKALVYLKKLNDTYKD